jgi:RNA 2',3'-cyclic 3'-phosphodiesterase
VRLFAALWPDPAAVAALRAVLREDPDWPPPGWRAVPEQRWHLTLAFHGDSTPDRVRPDGAGLRAPRLRVDGLLRLRGVLAAGVTTAGPRDADALRSLVAAAGGEPGGFLAHLTVARSTRRAGPVGEPALATHRGPWWVPRELCLVRSELGGGPPRYTVVHRTALDPPHQGAPPAADGG